MYLLIILLPLIGSIISGFFGRKVGVNGSQFITCSLIISTAILVTLVLAEIGVSATPVSIYLLRWVDMEYINVSLGFNFDVLTALMLIPVLFVSSAVHIYSVGYMSNDPHNQRFFSYLSLFTFMMIILVTANNYLVMFIGWEGVGICSYLLVNFWFTRIAANQSSIAAILTNRVGDCFLTLGMFSIIWSLGNLDYATVFSLAPFINENVTTIIGICLLIGAMAKSSQIGLHVWLPMAMEGPTPVSALIHAATMVTAGVYLLIRSSPLIEYSTTVLLLCLWIGAITTLSSSLIGLFQQDIKKVIAYSTMSQLGLMVVAIGLSSYIIALYHLVNHAFYKALLFLGAGSVIHAVEDKQDFRKYGALKRFLPLSYSVMLIASLSLVAFPFMTGYFSKDFILESSYGRFQLSSIIVYYLATIGAIFTTLYSIKTLYLTFLVNPNGNLISYRNAHEGNLFMSIPLIFLALFSIYFGYITKDMFVGLGSGLFTDNSIFIHPDNDIMINTEFAVATIFKLLPFILTINLILMSSLISEYYLTILMWFKLNRFGYNIFSFFNLRLSIELLYNKYISGIIFKLGGHTTRVLDKGVIEYVGPYGLQKTIYYISKILSLLDTGIVTTYAVYILIGGLSYMCLPVIFSFMFGNIVIIIIFFSSLITMCLPQRLSMVIYNRKKHSNMRYSQINYKYYLIKFIRISIMAIILFFLRDYLVQQFCLCRDNLIDYLVLVNISAICNEIAEYLWPTSHYHILGGEFDSENKTNKNMKISKVKSLFMSSTNNNETTSNTASVSNPAGNSSSSSSSSAGSPIGSNIGSPVVNPMPDNVSVSSSRSITPPPGGYHPPGPGQAIGPMGGADVTAFANRDSFAVTIMDGTPADLLKITTPMTTAEHLNEPERVICIDKVDANGNTIGVYSCVRDANNNEIAARDVAYVPGPNHRENNPVQRSQYYRWLVRRDHAKLEESLGSGTAYDAEGKETLETRQLRYNAAFNRAKIWECWGTYNSYAHRTALEMRLADNQLVTPREPTRFPHTTHFPGTGPTNRDS